jgi:putative transcriptional regulator
MEWGNVYMIRMKLSKFIAESGLTQEQLSRLTGIRQASISGYVSNNFKHIVKDHLDILCNFFNCEPQDLIERIKNTD